MPCATPPWICPSTIVGFTIRPQSCCTTYSTKCTTPVSLSTSTTAAWQPLANVPAPQLKRLVSPVTTVTSRGSHPSASAAICANVVWWPCPCVVRPVATYTLPLGSTRTCAPSYGPMPVPST